MNVGLLVPCPVFTLFSAKSKPSQAKPLESKEKACLPGQMVCHLGIKNNFLLIFLQGHDVVI